MDLGRQRGFTILELVVTLAVVGVLLATTVWEIGRTLPTYRVAATTSRFLHDLRSAAAIAARINLPVVFQFEVDAGDCALGYSIRREGSVFQSVCLSKEYRGVGTVETLAAVRCQKEEDLALDPLPSCSLCEGGSIVFLPTGEVQTAGAVGDSIVFADPEGRLTRAIGLRGPLGRASIYQWDGAEWECR